MITLSLTSTPLPGQGLVPATPGHEIWQSGLLADAATKDPGLYQGPSNIGWKKPSHQPQVSLTNWQKVCWSSGKPWNLWPHSLMQEVLDNTLHPPTESKSHPHRCHQHPWILQLLGNEAAAEAIGLRPEVSFAVAHGIGWSKPTATTWAASPSASPTPKVEPQQEDTISQWWTPPPGFMQKSWGPCMGITHPR